MSSVIELQNISKSYKKTQALDDVSLVIPAGQLYALIGPDGAGKSSLMHIMAGVLDPDEGSVHALNIDVLAYPEKLKPRIGLMAQGLGHTLYPELSIEENINYFAAIRNVAKNERNDLKKLLLESTQLDRFTTRKAKNLSGGMKQKLALCCSLIHSPELLFLDEPTTGVDPVSRRDFYKVLQNFIKERGVSIVISTSYMDEAERCHGAALMHEGKVLQSGSVTDLKANFESTILELITSEANRAHRILQEYAAVDAVYQRGQRLTIELSDPGKSKAVKSILTQNDFQAPQTREVDIEHLFIRSIASDRTDSEESMEDLVGQLLDSRDSETEQNVKDESISTEKLTKKFGKFTAVNLVDLKINRGEIFGFLGPNGAGKTTLIKMLCGLYSPSSGEGEVLGLALGQNGKKIAQRIGYMSQKFSLYADMTVKENIELYGGIYGLAQGELQSKVEIALKLAELEGRENDRAKSLPLGIKQRLALSCAILHNPELLFLDEPTSGVDPLVRDRFWRIIYLLSRKLGMTVIVTTHYMDEAERCDRLLMMLNGTVKAVGSPKGLQDEVAKQIGQPVFVNTPTPGKAYELLKNSYQQISRFGANLLVYCEDQRHELGNIESLLSGIQVNSVYPGRVPFEDIFIYFAEAQHEAVV